MSLLFVSLIVSWLLWGVVIIFFGPQDFPVVGVILFFLTGGTSVFTGSLVLFLTLRKLVSKHTPLYLHFRHSVRESILLTITFIVGLILARFDMASQVTIIILISILFFVELYYSQTYDRRYSQKNHSTSGAGKE